MRRLALLVLPVAAAGIALLAGPGTAEGETSAHRQSPSRTGQSELVARGQELFLLGCSNCHGADGRGVTTEEGELRGPSLESAGKAAAYYQVSTGRMPLANSDDIPMRKESAYGPRQIDALVAYVGTLGQGPPVPEVTTSPDLRSTGGVLYRTNCQACHSASGAGGALSYGHSAPTLSKASPTQIGAAMRSGPGQMPVFGKDAISDQDLDAIASYVEYLEAPNDRGGVSLGRLGPIPEGFLIWVLGIGGLLVLCVLIGKRWMHEPEVRP